MMHFIIDDTPESDIEFMQQRIKFLTESIKKKDEKIENLEAQIYYWRTQTDKLETKLLINQTRK